MSSHGDIAPLLQSHWGFVVAILIPLVSHWFISNDQRTLLLLLSISTFASCLINYYHYSSSDVECNRLKRQLNEMKTTNSSLKKQLFARPIVQIVEPKNSITFESIHNETSYRLSKMIRHNYNEHQRYSILSSSTRPNSLNELFSPLHHHHALPRTLQKNNSKHNSSITGSPTMDYESSRSSSFTNRGYRSSRQFSRPSSNADFETDIQLTDLIDMDFELNPENMNRTDSSINEEEKTIHPEAPDFTDFTDETTYSQDKEFADLATDGPEFDINKRTWSTVNRKRLSLASMWKSVVYSDEDEYQQGLKSFKLVG